MKPPDARHFLAVSAAVRAALSAILDRGVPITAAARAAASSILTGQDLAFDLPAPERPAERLRRQNATAMAAMAVLEEQGKARSAATIVAARMAVDPHDPTEVEILAQRFRRLRRDKKNEQRSFATEPSE